ncbi:MULTISPECIES: HAD-IA family hydrolase [unclassified Leptolyngbya]|uniref:HAD-IA family hydrolase n=1 Tax=unclassified Leptolyngbya TaxID=2650499 RepID=UPI00168390FC|nr:MULTISPECIES: HAD-IA family hydrolase [unclassified Leptolyngbya]MBD1909862.1 HAD-IA family hydrolase [Leptolyngbya sp. FACHB-8]MBD2156958.1 HAD-IA family hydrolase [Leptolyngbya sp. FACHB-16]
MAIEGVILDVDGTLVASNDTHAQAWVAAFAAFGYEIPFEQVRPMMGMGGDQIIPRLVPGLTSKEGVGQQITQHRRELIVNEYSNALAPTQGARDLVQKLRDNGLHLIIASSASDQEMDVLLDVAQVKDLVPEITNSSDADATKPAPDIVEAALNKAHLQPDRTVMLGDTPYDIEAANKAGVSVIALRSGGFDDQQLQGAIAIYDDPADLLRHYETSPLSSTAPTPITPAAKPGVSDEPSFGAPSNSWGSFQNQPAAYLENALESARSFFNKNQPVLVNLGWVFLALIGLQLVFTILDVVNHLPLIAPFLELVGLTYTSWFVWRYLLKANTRQELGEKIQQTKAELLGDRNQ